MMFPNPDDSIRRKVWTMKAVNKQLGISWEHSRRCLALGLVLAAVTLGAAGAAAQSYARGASGSSADDLCRALGGLTCVHGHSIRVAPRHVNALPPVSLRT